MQTVDQILELFRYNAWANRRVVSALLENRVDRARQVLAHLLVTELFNHVLIHSAMHRGNIVIKLRDVDIVPPATDYIIYLREKRQA